MQEFRDYINDNTHNNSLGDNARWLEFCSHMDVIEDCAEAHMCYLSLCAGESSIGSIYLYAYGALDCIYIQQTAVRNIISIASGQKFDLYETVHKAKEICDWRHRIIHAPKSDNKSSFIVRHLSTPYSIMIHTYDKNEDHNPTVTSLNIRDLIAENNGLIISTIQNQVLNSSPQT